MALPPSTPAPAPKLRPYRPFGTVVWVIRCTGAILASVSLLLGIAGIFAALHIAITSPDTENWIKILLVLAPLIGFGLLFLIGYSMYMVVDGLTLSYFVFVFSLLVAITFYQLLPVELPGNIADYIKSNLPSVQFGDWLDIAYRATFAVIAFFVFYAMIESYLHRAMGFDTPVRRSLRTKSGPKVDPFDKTSKSKDGTA
jgi:hypothetical protein